MRRRYMIGLLPSIVSTITMNQLIGDPYSRVTGDINGEAIQWIRQNSHIYLCKYKDNMMYICQLDDSNSNYYHDGTSAALNNLGVDVMMKLPIFYTKAENTTSSVWNISFSNVKKDNTWMEWGGDLIGVYEGFVNSNKLYSVVMSGSSSTGSISQADFKTYARNRGDGFTLVKWKHQNIMALLYYAMYGNTNCQKSIGSGTYSHAKEMGITNELGMTDTVAGGNGDSNSIKFWGLENWWGNKSEWVDNVIVNPESADGLWRITEDDGTTRDVQGIKMDGFPTEFIIGQHLDVIPKTASGSITVGYCDYIYTNSGSTTRVVRRSDGYNNTNGGVAYADAYRSSSSKYSDVGSRLAYRGPITEIEDVSEFKTL